MEEGFVFNISGKLTAILAGGPYLLEVILKWALKLLLTRAHLCWVIYLNWLGTQRIHSIECVCVSIYSKRPNSDLDFGQLTLVRIVGYKKAPKSSLDHFI